MERPYVKIRLSEEMKAWLAELAKSNNRTLQGQVVQLFQEKMQAGQAGAKQ